MLVGMATVEQFAVDEFAEELAAAPTNFEVATKLVFENDRIRVWEMHLEPGQRQPFHCHGAMHASFKKLTSLMLMKPIWLVGSPPRGVAEAIAGAPSMTRPAAAAATAPAFFNM